MKTSLIGAGKWLLKLTAAYFGATVFAFILMMSQAAISGFLGLDFDGERLWLAAWYWSAGCACTVLFLDAKASAA
ncbi:hypothetical protein D3C87_925500 [compost metagenome]